MTPRLRSALGGAAALVVVVAAAAAVDRLQADDTGALAGPSVRPAATSSPTLRSAAPRRTRTAPAEGLPTVSPAELPVEARRTLSLIARGGPFPYDRDGIVFGNAERLLPPQPRGCYHEYTVRTPGESDRGARRIITSCTGAEYWTPDHYESFARIVGARL